MQAKPQKIIKLANRSRKNRVFFDQLIRMLAVELHLGSDELNRFHLMVLDERGLRGIKVLLDVLYGICKVVGGNLHFL